MTQALGPDEIEKAEFHTTIRGYARDEVREFQSAIAALVKDLHEKAETGYLNLGEKMGELLQHAKDAAEEMTSTARAEALRVTEEANANAARTEQEASARATDAVDTAQQHASKIIREAEQRVAELQATESAIRGELQSVRTELENLTAKLRQLEPKRVGVDPETEASFEQQIYAEERTEQADVGV